MSASPGDPQPVFDLIARRARDLCHARGASLHEFDGELIHLRSLAGAEAFGAPDAVGRGSVRRFDADHGVAIGNQVAKMATRRRITPLRPRKRPALPNAPFGARWRGEQYLMSSLSLAPRSTTRANSTRLHALELGRGAGKRRLRRSSPRGAHETAAVWVTRQRRKNLGKGRRGWSISSNRPSWRLRSCAARRSPNRRSIRRAPRAPSGPFGWPWKSHVFSGFHSRPERPLWGCSRPAPRLASHSRSIRYSATNLHRHSRAPQPPITSIIGARGQGTRCLGLVARSARGEPGRRCDAVTGFGSLIFASCRTDWLIRGVLPMLPGHLRVIPIAVTTWPDALIARRPAQLSFMPARDGPGDGLFPSRAMLFVGARRLDDQPGGAIPTRAPAAVPARAAQRPPRPGRGRRAPPVISLAIAR